MSKPVLGRAASVKKKKVHKVTGTMAHITKATAAKDATTGKPEGERERKPARQKPATVDLSQCHNEGVDLVRLIISLHPQYLVEARHRLNHFAMHTASDGDSYYNNLASILWTGRAAAKNLESFQRMNMKLGSVRTNHFPAIDDMCNKSYLARKLKFFQRVCPPGNFEFIPRTWLLPQEWEQFRAEVIAVNSGARTQSIHTATPVGATTATTTAAAASSTPSSPVAPTYIFKPSGGSQGAGISLGQQLSDCERIYRSSVDNGTLPLVVQEYIPQPLLLGGLKFDFRVYCLLESIEPLRFHLYKEGLARFCTEAYQAPNKRNLKEAFMHLTNASLNKQNEEKFRVTSTAEWAAQGGLIPNAEQKENGNSRSANSSPPSSSTTPQFASNPQLSSSLFNLDALPFDSSSSDPSCSKRSVRLVLSQLRQAGHTQLTDEAFWLSVKRIVEQTLMSLWAPLLANYKVAFPLHKPARDSELGSSSTSFPSACFHILGFDILLDSALCPWLLEMNCSPSLNMDSVMDLVVKKGMVEGALGILGYLGEERKRKVPPPVGVKKRETNADAADDASSASSTPDGGSAAASHSAPSSSSNTPQQHAAAPASSSDVRSSPLTLNPKEGSIVAATSSLPPPHPSSSSATPAPTAAPVIPVIPSFSRRSSATSLNPINLAKRYVILPGGAIKAMEEEPAPAASSKPPASTAAAPSDSAPSPPSSSAPPSIPHALDSEPAEYMHICPEEEWLATCAQNGVKPGPLPHPLLFFQHWKLQAIFERYTAGSSVKKLSSSKFMQACVNCRICVSGSGGAGAGNAASKTAAPAATTTATSTANTSSTPSAPAAAPSSAPVPKPLSNWPTRPDIDLLFLSHTKFEAVGVTNASIGAPGTGSNAMLDWAGFCEVLFQIAETKYEALIAPHLLPNGPAGKDKDKDKDSAAKGSPRPNGTAPPAYVGTMTPLEAFLAFVDTLVLPEEKGAASKGGDASEKATREQAAKLAASQLAVSINAPPASSFSTSSATGSPSALVPPPKSPNHRKSGSFSGPSAGSVLKVKDSPPSTGAPSPVISQATLAATLSSLLAPKDPSASVFNRLTGVAPPVHHSSSTSVSLKSKRKELRKKKEMQAGTYEAFMAAYQAKKAKTQKK